MLCPNLNSVRMYISLEMSVLLISVDVLAVMPCFVHVIFFVCKEIKLKMRSGIYIKMMSIVEVTI